MQRIHKVLLIIPAALLLLFGAYVYLIGSVGMRIARNFDQIPELRRSVAEAASGTSPMSQKKTLEITSRAIDLIEAQKDIADTAVGYFRDIGAWILILGAAQAAAVIYVIRRSHVPPAA